MLNGFSGDLGIGRGRLLGGGVIFLVGLVVELLLLLLGLVRLLVISGGLVGSFFLVCLNCGRWVMVGMDGGELRRNRCCLMCFVVLCVGIMVLVWLCVWYII